MRVLVVRDASILPHELINYDILLVSYHFVMAQHRKIDKYLDSVRRVKEGEVGITLERPNISIFSEIFFKNNGIKSPYLVLDEVNAVKNPHSRTFLAVQELRTQADTCIMLSGTPVDNTWLDVYALLQFVGGHDINTKRKMQVMFGDPDPDCPGRFKPPTAWRFCRLIQLLNTFVVRRPEDTVDLPRLEERVIRFQLDEDEAAKSNDAFTKYLGTRYAPKSGTARGGRELRPLQGRFKVAGTGDDDTNAQWRYLTQATQHAFHPEMVQIMQFARNPLLLGDGASADILMDHTTIRRWQNWREMLGKDRNWESSRITALIDAFNERRDTDPDCSVLVFDESAYFLDIVQVAFSAMYEPVECLRFDGRQSLNERSDILRKFEAAAGAKVLLISLAAGDLGLNITSANTVILCGPWWKKGWEEQAVKCVWHKGQTRPVLVLKLFAMGCELEDYKAKKRDRKNKHISPIVEKLTMPDGEMPHIWDKLE